MVKDISFTCVPTFQHGRFVINLVHLRGSTMVAKILDFGLSQSLKNALSRILYSPKVSLERWFLHFFCKNFSEFPPDLIIEVSIIVFLLAQLFSWFENYKSSWFSNFVTCASFVSVKTISYFWHGSPAYNEDGSQEQRI